MGGGDEEVLHDVLFFGFHPRHALAAPPLAPVEVDVGPLDVAGTGHGDHHLFVGEQVLNRQIRGLGEDFGAALVPVLGLDGLQLVLDQPHEARFRREDPLEVGDQYRGLLVLFNNLVALELGQPLELHVQNRLGLNLGEVQAVHQGRLGGVGTLRAPNQADDQVKVVNGLPEPLENVGPLLGPGQIVPGPTGHHLAAEADERLQHLPEVHHLGTPVHERQHDDPKGRLHLGVLIELVQGDLRDLASREFKDDADPLTVRFIPPLGDPLDLLLPDQLPDFFDQGRFVHLIGKLGNDDRLAPAAHLLRMGLGPHGDGASSRRVRLTDPSGAVDVAARGKVRPRDHFQQLLHGGGGVINQEREPVHHLHEVVGRDVGGHAHRDAGGAVDKKVRDFGGKDRGLDERLVKVGDKVRGPLVDVRQHLVGDLRQARLGVPHGGGGVAVDRSEVPLPVHQRVAEGELLRHADQRLIDRGIAVGVVLAEDFSDHAGRFLVGTVPGQAQLRHGVEDAAVNRLESVTDVRQRPSDDDGHGVVQVGLPHLLFDGNGSLALGGHEGPLRCRC